MNPFLILAKNISRALTGALLAGSLVAGCGGAGDAPAGEARDPFSSDVATLMDFEFDGELLTTLDWNAEQAIQDQMLYTIGLLNGADSVGRLDVLELSNIETHAEADALFRVTYHAHLPVAWGSKTDLPASFEVILPRNMDYSNLTAFASKYSKSCAEWSDHAIDSGSMWYYYRPNQGGCTLDPSDVVRTTATVARSSENTDGKYPEYDKVWEDGTLIVVSIFGKYEDGATSNGDAGISAYNRFLAAMRSELGASVKTTPAELPANPGVAQPDVTFEGTRDGKTIRIDALLVDNVRTAGRAFDARYEELSTEADLIAYNGHAGLGSNVRALARKGRFRAGKYQIVFMNGCDTFAYVDGSLAETRARLNPDDPTGTKYMDMITNGLPSFFASNAGNDRALIRGLLSTSSPMTYQQIFRGIDRSQVVVVTGEEDNAFHP